MAKAVVGVAWRIAGVLLGMAATMGWALILFACAVAMLLLGDRLAHWARR